MLYNLLKEIELLYKKTKGNYELYKDISTYLLKGYYFLSYPYSTLYKVEV